MTMFTYEWKTYEQFTEYEKMLFQVNKQLYFGYSKRIKGKKHYFVLYKDGKPY